MCVAVATPPRCAEQGRGQMPPDSLGSGRGGAEVTAEAGRTEGGVAVPATASAQPSRYSPLPPPLPPLAGCPSGVRQARALRREPRPLRPSRLTSRAIWPRVSSSAAAGLSRLGSRFRPCCCCGVPMTSMAQLPADPPPFLPAAAFSGCLARLLRREEAEDTAAPSAHAWEAGARGRGRIPRRECCKGRSQRRGGADGGYVTVPSG